MNLPRAAVAFPEVKVAAHPVSVTLEGHTTWSASLVQLSAGFLRFHFVGLPPWARLAFLAGKNEPPTLTQHELLELINPNKHNAPGSSNSQPTRVFRKRDSDHRAGVSVELLDYFEPGTWFVTVVNDGAESVPLLVNISHAADIPTHCNNNCNGHGKCHLGKCQCYPGYIGHDCADSEYQSSFETMSFGSRYTIHAPDACVPFSHQYRAS